MKLSAWEHLAIEVALERVEKQGGFEEKSLKSLIDKIAKAKEIRVK